MKQSLFAYLDECVDYQLVEALRKRDLFVTSVFDEGTEGLSDREQLDYAGKRGWTLVTHNEKHFWPLFWRYRPHVAIIVLPERPPFRRLEVRAAMMLRWLTGRDDRLGFFKWGQFQEMLEQGYRLPGFDRADIDIALGREDR